MAMIRPQRTGLPKPVEEEEVSVKLVDLYSSLLKQQAADAVIALLLRHDCPVVDERCYWCGALLWSEGPNTQYVGHKLVAHDEGCPFKDALAYASVFLPQPN
jgi:hypothetical protein